VPRSPIHDSERRRGQVANHTQFVDGSDVEVFAQGKDRAVDHQRILVVQTSATYCLEDVVVIWIGVGDQVECLSSDIDVDVVRSRTNHSSSVDEILGGPCREGREPDVEPPSSTRLARSTVA
jgi:hypothetical protein